MSVKRLATLIVAVLMLGAMLPATALAVPSKTSNSPCPSSNGLGTFVPATNVGATWTDNLAETERTYSFVSFVNENPTNGVPGLVGYCVYTDVRPSDVATSVPNWSATVLKGSKGFVFARGDNPRGSGNKYNVPLDGGTHAIGTATFSDLPTSQIILLHINDVAQCTALYGGLSPSTCWVLPSAAPDPCATGVTNVAYNDMPTGVIDCYKPSEAFEAQGVGEFGQEVVLKTGTGRALTTLEVLFASYGCSVSGHWNTGDCVTNAADTFTHPITANVYDPAVSLTVPLATVTQTFTIPYRPSADPGNCPLDYHGAGAANGSAWFNPLAPAGDKCIYSKSTVLMFTFPAGTALPDEVVWSVAFNTSGFGASPLGYANPCNSSLTGCPYDSLNVGTKTYTGAPYAGSFSVADQAFKNGAFDSGWTGFAPLGRITTTP